MKRSFFPVCILVAITALVFVGCGGQTAPVAPGPSVAPAVNPAEASQDVKPEGSAPAQAAAGMAAPAPASQPAGAPLTKETIVGKKFSKNGMEFGFEKDGALKVGMGGVTVDGTWSIDGNTVTVAAMGKEYKAEISGSQLLVQGEPLQPVQ
jgi:hypothetical protein